MSTVTNAATTNVFAHAGVTYFDHGYAPIPLRRNIDPTKKPNPPVGITGRGGRYLARAQIEPELSKGTVVGIGLRMTPDLVGIDVDVYRGGGETFLQLIEEHGALPPTCITHSNRGDGSGIRFYRIPVGTALITKLPGIEFIQHWHRYALVAPSLHPEGRAYGWLDEQEMAACDGPWDFDELPELPWTWIEALRGGGSKHNSYAATSEEVADFIRTHTASSNPRLLHVVLEKAAAQVDAGNARHDVLLDALPWAMRDARAGLYPATLAIDTIEGWWLTTFGDPAKGRLEPGEDEFEGLLLFAIGAAIKETDEEIAERADRVNDNVTVDEILAAALERLAEKLSVSSYHPIDLTPYLDGTDEAIRGDLMLLPGEGDDVEGLLYTDRLNEIHGDSGAGKSWTIAYVIRERARGGHTTMVIDLEDTAATLVLRLRQIGLMPRDIAKHLVFIHPDEEWSVANVGLLVDTIARRGITHVFIDSLGEAFGVDGISENNDDEVTPWIRKVPRRIISETGAGVTLIDHITKAAENPLYPSGTKRKRAAITGTSWYAYAVEPFTKNRGGRIRFMSGKDRQGNFRRGEDVADMVMTVVGPMCSLELHRLAQPEPEREVNIDIELQRLAVVAAEKYRPDAVPKKALLSAMREVGAKGRDDRFRGAIELAVLREFLREDIGPRGAQSYTYLRDWEPMTGAEWVEKGKNG